MTDKPAESAVERYNALEWAPDGEMGFDPGGREVKAAADDALAELKAANEALRRERDALKSLFTEHSEEVCIDCIGTCHLFHEHADCWQPRADDAEAALAKMQKRVEATEDEWRERANEQREILAKREQHIEDCHRNVERLEAKLAAAEAQVEEAYRSIAMCSGVCGHFPAFDAWLAKRGEA